MARTGETVFSPILFSRRKLMFFAQFFPPAGSPKLKLIETELKEVARRFNHVTRYLYDTIHINKIEFNYYYSEDSLKFRHKNFRECTNTLDSQYIISFRRSFCIRSKDMSRHPLILRIDTNNEISVENCRQKFST